MDFRRRKWLAPGTSNSIENPLRVLAAISNRSIFSIVYPKEIQKNILSDYLWKVQNNN